MMDLETAVKSFFTTYAYEPYWVYTGLFAFMYASAFGLPLPEEIVLVSSGFLAYVALHPDIMPPPDATGTPVNPYVLAGIALTAVVTSDIIIWSLGKHFGRRMLNWSWVQKILPPERQSRVQDWSHRYGFWASGIFRFTPGLRFPGHLFCGMMRIPLWKFVAVDGTAALITVPTQILLIAHYGDAILKYFKDFKIALLSALALMALYFLARRYWSRRTGDVNSST